MSVKSTTFFPIDGNRLAFLSPVINELFSIYNSYLERHDKVDAPDRPFFYNERAQLSLLMGAVWRASPYSLALEEYRCGKQTSEGKYSGRVDAWFEFQNERCCVECKSIDNFSIRSFSEVSASGCVELALREANTVAMNNRDEIYSGNITTAFGLVFVCPYIPWKCRDDQPHGKYDTLFISSIGKHSAVRELTHHFLKVSYYPEHLQTEERFHGEKAGDKLWTCPGVDLLFCVNANTGLHHSQ
jgi:hypothetical protein